ncbi:MAG: hypothetical protein ACTMH4_12975 [Sphingobacterium sp.]
MTTVLYRHLNWRSIEFAKDIVRDTFLKVSEHWATNGIPDSMLVCVL